MTMHESSGRASMGPPSMNGGRWGRCAGSAGIPRASMGPPSMNGGRLYPRRPRSRGAASFNGAAVDERRKGERLHP